ncbi:MAG: hypothetical protein FWH37_09360 [Candidatus Bathyarchaeota archaeon]|nr:hypothetical protein [Candidatus Termiticorpusculum sp.]
MKRFCLLLMVLILSCEFISIGIVQAQSKPSVPEFTVKLVDNSYNVPPTQSTDPYTGKTTTQPSYHVEEKEIEITIKNQNYPSKLMYNIRTKGHFEENWTEMFSAGGSMYPHQSNSKYTIITISSNNYPDGAQVDFQVEAMSGGISQEVYSGLGTFDYFDGVTSGWSKTQTLTIDKNSNGAYTQAPDTSEIPPNISQPKSFTWINLACVVLIAVVITVIVMFFIFRKTSNIIT